MKNQVLYQLTLVEALGALRAKRFSAQEYCAELQQRIAERDGDIEAWAHYDPCQGLSAARRSDMRALNAAMVEEVTLPPEFDGALQAAQTIMRSEAVILRSHPY